MKLSQAVPASTVVLTATVKTANLASATRKISENQN